MQQDREGHGATGTLIVRHHPVLLMTRAWRPGALLLIAAILIVVIATGPTGAGLPGLWLGLAAALFLVGGVWAASEYLVWSNHRLYLTPTRLIEVSGVSGFTQERRELRLERLQSVELDVRNLLLRWAGCADVIISVTASGALRFAAAREPLLVRDGILARLDERNRIHDQTDDSSARASVEELLGLDPPPLLPQPDEAHPASRRRTRRRLPQLQAPYFGHRVGGVAWRRHPWFLVRAWFAPGLLLSAGAALPFAIDRLGLTMLFGYVGFLTLSLIIAAFVWGWWLWADWRNDHYVVTPDRLIEIEQLPLGLRQQFSEAALDKVEDIRCRIPNPLASLLNYGDVLVSTASTEQPFIFRGIARPRQLAAQIDRHVTALHLAAEQSRHIAMRAEFARWLTAYNEASADAREDEAEGDATVAPPDMGAPGTVRRRPQTQQ